MSRSYKEPYEKQSTKHTKYHKQLANRRARRKLKNEECTTQHKKLTDSYDISDWKGRSDDVRSTRK